MGPIASPGINLAATRITGLRVPLVWLPFILIRGIGRREVLHDQ